MATAVFGAGCFWCVEAVFQRLKGVSSVIPGYTGGSLPNPTYKQVCEGNTGHAEVIQITFDPDTVSFTTLLDVFFHTHDPTTLNRQGEDIGTQYRSVVFCQDEHQKTETKNVLEQVSASGVWPNPIVTEIADKSPFYPAEDYHHNYFSNNSDQGYCSLVINPKVQKFKLKYRTLLKDELR